MNKFKCIVWVSCQMGLGECPQQSGGPAQFAGRGGSLVPLITVFQVPGEGQQEGKRGDKVPTHLITPRGVWNPGGPGNFNDPWLWNIDPANLWPGLPWLGLSWLGLPALAWPGLAGLGIWTLSIS